MHRTTHAPFCPWRPRRQEYLLNALAADDAQVLPAGGKGPLTDQTTEVNYSEVPMFRMVYHPKSHLLQNVFALEYRLTQQSKQAAKLEKEAQISELTQGRSEEEKREAIDHAASNAVGAEKVAAVDSRHQYHTGLSAGDALPAGGARLWNSSLIDWRERVSN